MMVKVLLLMMIKDNKEGINDDDDYVLDDDDDADDWPWQQVVLVLEENRPLPLLNSPKLTFLHFHPPLNFYPPTL